MIKLMLVFFCLTTADLAASAGGRALPGIRQMLRARSFFLIQALHIATRLGNTNQIIDLLDQGINIDSLDSLQQTPLYVAITERNYMMVKFLIDHGANPAEHAPDGGTIFQYVNRVGDKKMWKIMFPAHAGLNR